MTIEQFKAKKKNDLFKDIEQTVTFYFKNNMPMYELNPKVDLITHKHFENPTSPLKMSIYIYAKEMYKYNSTKNEIPLEYAIEDLNFFINKYEPTKKEIKQAKKLPF